MKRAEGTTGGEIRFGLRSGDLRSATFKVWALKDRDDVYILSREVGREFKVSLHESGTWHYRWDPTGPHVALGPGTTQTWQRPPARGGITRAFAVLIPAGSVRTPIEPETEERVAFVELPEGAAARQFTVAFEAPGAIARPPADAQIVGRIKLAIGGETVLVVAQPRDDLPTVEPFASGPTSVPVGHAEESFDALKERLLREPSNYRALVFADDADGMRWFIDAAVEIRPPWSPISGEAPTDAHAPDA